MKKLAASMLALVGAAAFAQGAYRWVGQDGKVHYSDEPPPPEARKVEQKRLGASVVGGDKHSYEMRRAMENFPVTLYVSSDCGSACDSGRGYLSKRGIPFAEKSLASAEDHAAFRKATNADTLPTLLVGKNASKGFLESEWAGALDAAGYPGK